MCGTLTFSDRWVNNAQGLTKHVKQPSLFDLVKSVLCPMEKYVKSRDWDILVTEGFEEKFSLRTINTVTTCNRPITLLFALIGRPNCLLLPSLQSHNITHTSSTERNKCISRHESTTCIFSQTRLGLNTVAHTDMYVTLHKYINRRLL